MARPKKMGAPEKPFDWNLLESLALLEAEMLYVAERMLIGQGAEVNSTAINSMVKRIGRKLKARFNCGYVEYKEQKKEYKKTKLRQLMWKNAENGNVTMQIWLSKQILGYSDKVEQKITEAPTIKLKYSIDDDKDKHAEPDKL